MVLQDFVFFIPPPPHYNGSISDFSLSLDSCWYGRVKLVFAFHVRTDDGSVMECQCAFIETLYPYFPVVQKKWWPSTAEIGTRLLYLPSPEPVVYVVPLSHILGKLPLVPAGDSGTIPCNMHGSKASCYPKGTCDRDDAPGSGSRLFYLNTWAMIWPTDYRNSDSESPDPESEPMSEPMPPTAQHMNVDDFARQLDEDFDSEPEGHSAGQGLDLAHSPAGADIGSLEWADADE